MYFVRPNFLLRSLYPSALWRIPTKEKKIFLTFDDGPVPEVTPLALSILQEYNAKATFFCVGANIEKHPEIFRQIISEGHSIGNHTNHHLNGWKTTTKKYLDNVEQCNFVIKQQFLNPIGNNSNMVNSQFSIPNLFRPPYGKMKLSQYAILHTQYSVVMWDVLSGDFDKKTSEEKCFKNVIGKTREGSIVVFHDNMKAKKNLIYSLPRYIEHFSNKGFEFMPLLSCVKIAG